MAVEETTNTKDAEAALPQARKKNTFKEKIQHNELDVFLEAAEATVASACVFILADLRSLALKKVITGQDAEDILRLPVDGPYFRQLFKKHDLLLKRFRSHDFTPVTDTYMNTHSRERSLEVHYIEDQRADKECVHFIGRDHDRNSILLVFRGSITPHDWSEDFKLMTDDVPNPLYGIEDQPQEIGIHWGFRNYLHGKNPALVNKVKKVAKQVGNGLGTSKEKEEMEKNVDVNSTTISSLKSDREENRTKIDIVIEQLREMKKEFPGDPIYIVGHSLGGALALIAALSVAADPVLSAPPFEAPLGMTPVTVIGVANPKPGNRAFTNAMLHLERAKKLRCLCVHNAFDVVPRMPPNVGNRDGGFWHPGYRLLLYKHRVELGRSQASKPQIQESTIVNCFGGCNMLSHSKWNMTTSLSPVAAIKHMSPQSINQHNYRLYLQRLMDHESTLSTVRLNEYYREVWKDANQWDANSTLDEWAA